MNPNAVTNSERSAAACPQRWLFKYGLALRPEGRVYALDVGSFVHDALETLFDAFSTGALFPLTDALDTIEKVRLREVERIKEAGASSTDLFDPMQYVDPLDIDRVNEAAEVAASLVAGYHAFWDNDPFTVIRNEGTLASPVIAPSGRPSSRTSFAGKVDKVVEYRGRRLIMEHKTTSLDLGEWYEKHRRSPQVRGYAFALQREGVDVDGVIYDLIQSKPPRAWDDLAVLKDGSRLAKPKGLPWTTATEFATAVLQVHGDPDPTLDIAERVRLVVAGHKKPESVAWYNDALTEMLARDRAGFWYRREVDLFTPGEIDRVGREIYHDATRIRRWKDRVEPYRQAVLDAAPMDVPHAIEDALHDVGHEFPRQSSLCWQWNRLCSFAALCASHSAHDVYGFRIERAPGGHAELAETTNTTPTTNGEDG